MCLSVFYIKLCIEKLFNIGIVSDIDFHKKQIPMKMDLFSFSIEQKLTTFHLEIFNYLAKLAK